MKNAFFSLKFSNIGLESVNRIDWSLFWFYLSWILSAKGSKIPIKPTQSWCRKRLIVRFCKTMMIDRTPDSLRLNLKGFKVELRDSDKANIGKSRKLFPKNGHRELFPGNFFQIFLQFFKARHIISIRERFEHSCSEWPPLANIGRPRQLKILKYLSMDEILQLPKELPIVKKGKKPTFMLEFPPALCAKPNHSWCTGTVTYDVTVTDWPFARPCSVGLGS